MATTSAAGLQEKQLGASGLGGISELLSLLGNKQTTTSTANTAPLQQVFSQASQPMSMELYNAMIGDIFNTAAQQIPEFTGALANATGTRSSSNSPLALALSQQQQRAGQAAAQQILNYNTQQQQIAGQAASGIAGATKGSTATTAPSVNPLLALGGGFLLNQADKRGWIDKGIDSISGIFGGGSATDYSALPNISFGNGFGTGFSGSDSLTGLTSGLDFTGGGTNYLSSPDAFGMFGGDSFLGGLGSAATDFAGDFLSGAGDTISGALGGISDWFGFADGGMPGRVAGMPRDLHFAPPGRTGQWNSPYLSNVIPMMNLHHSRGYADGGVTRNRNYLGGPLQQTGMGALEVPAGYGMDSLGGNQGINSSLLAEMMVRAMQQQEQIGGQGVGVGGTDTPGGSLNQALGNPLGAQVANAMVGALMGNMTSGMTSNPLASQAISTGGKSMGVPMGGLAGLVAAMVSAGAAGQSATNAINAASDPLGALLLSLETAQPGKAGDMSAISGDTNSAVAAANAISAITGGNAMDALMDVTGGFGTVDGTNTVNVDGTGSSSAPDATSADTGGSSSSGTGDATADAAADAAAAAGSAAAWADGGKIRGRGTGVSDSIPAVNRIPGGQPARFSDGEFIIPADSVKILGEDLLNRLLQATHTPVRR